MDGAAGATAEQGFDQDGRGLFARQVLFTRCLAKLIDYATSRGYELTLAEIGLVYHRKRRDAPGKTFEDGEHMRDSLHYSRLAADLNLFVGGEYITNSDHPAWVDLGSYWKGLDILAAWGGDFSRPDGNHVSIRWGGRA